MALGRLRQSPVRLRLPYRGPYAVDAAMRDVAAHRVPGLERTDDGVLERVVRAPGGPALVAVDLGRGDGEARAVLRPAHPGDVAHLTLALRRWLDLDADPAAIDGVLGADPLLAPLVAARPGLRVRGAPDGFEATALAILGQQVSVAAARTLAGRLVAAFGPPVGDGLSAFPEPVDLAAAGPDALRATCGLTAARARSLHGLAVAVAGGMRLDPAVRPQATAALRALPGVGDWTVAIVSMRALGDRDALPADDLALRRALGVADARRAAARAEPWRPWRAYGHAHLVHAAAHAPAPPASRPAPPGRSPDEHVTAGGDGVTG